MDNLRITIIQSDIHWENPVANLAMFEEKIWAHGKPTDLILLPEMFTSGFTMNPKLVSEAMGMNTFRWMKQMAGQKDAVVSGSYVVREGAGFVNRLLWMEPDGKFTVYDKRHLFRMAGEHEAYTAGNTRPVLTLKGWKILPVICYDLRFPVWCRNTVNEHGELSYDVLCCVANWPEARVKIWDTLLATRAIENLAYSVGVNRIGTDGNEVAHNGHSAVFNLKGDALFQAGETELVETIELDAKELLQSREKFPAYRDADKFRLE